MEKQVFKSFEELGELYLTPKEEPFRKRFTLEELDAMAEIASNLWDTSDLVCQKLNAMLRKGFAGMGLRAKKIKVWKDTYILHTGYKEYWTIVVRIVGNKAIYAVSPYAALDFQYNRELLWTECTEEVSLGRAVSLWDRSRKGIKDQSVMDWRTFKDSVSVKSGWGLRKYSSY